jgi:lactose/L-arabinose transport system ATP-binding protein
MKPVPAALDLTIDMLEHLGGEDVPYARHGNGELIVVETKKRPAALGPVTA